MKAGSDTFDTDGDNDMVEGQRSLAAEYNYSVPKVAEDQLRQDNAIFSARSKDQNSLRSNLNSIASSSVRSGATKRSIMYSIASRRTTMQPKVLRADNTSQVSQQMSICSEQAD
jgi:hypothetical protein